MTAIDTTRSSFDAVFPGDGLKLSVVMPCLNEEENVEYCVLSALQAMASSQIEGEVIVVDNGSKDASAELAAQA
ncbi:MAG TPA: glycosyltransferase, partial [Solirubrobacteraceae bacterium]|nr:glycosyltransferase [Solirubrobacteraceae bacterium]